VSFRRCRQLAIPFRPTCTLQTQAASNLHSSVFRDAALSILKNRISIKKQQQPSFCATHTGSFTDDSDSFARRAAVLNAVLRQIACWAPGVGDFSLIYAARVLSLSPCNILHYVLVHSLFLFPKKSPNRSECLGGETDILPWTFPRPLGHCPLPGARKIIIKRTRLVVLKRK